MVRNYMRGLNNFWLLNKKSPQRIQKMIKNEYQFIFDEMILMCFNFG